MTIDQVKQNIQQLTNSEVEQLGVWIYGEEMNRRAAQPAIEQAQAEIVKDLQDAGKLPLPDALTDAEALPEDTSDVPEWVNPGTDHSAMYREGDIVRYKDRIVRSTHKGLNSWEPGTLNFDGRIWEDITPTVQSEAPEAEPEAEPKDEAEPEAPGSAEEKPAEFKAPTGAHDAYAKGAKVTYNGAVYESLIAANAYSPDAYPAGWKKLA